MKQIVVMLTFVWITCLPQLSYTHYRPEQYHLAETELVPVVEGLTLHIDTMEGCIRELQDMASKISDKTNMCGVIATLEIIRHHTTRAWYNRLLLQKLSEIRDGISLSQISAILRLTRKPLSNAVHQLDRVCQHRPNSAYGALCDKAKKTMRALLMTYDQALGIVKSAMIFDQDPG
jgi:hypothetical protein